MEVEKRSPLKRSLTSAFRLPPPTSSRSRAKRTDTLSQDVLETCVRGFAMIKTDTHRRDVQHCARLFFSVLCGHDEDQLLFMRLDIGELVEISSVQVFSQWMHTWDASAVTKGKKWELMVALAESVVKTERLKEFPFKKAMYMDKIDLAVKYFRRFGKAIRPEAQIEAGKRVSLEHAVDIGRFLTQEEFLRLMKASKDLLAEEVDFVKAADRSFDDWWDFQKVLILSLTIGIPVQRRQVLEDATFF